MKGKVAIVVCLLVIATFSTMTIANKKDTEYKVIAELHKGIRSIDMEMSKAMPFNEKVRAHKINVLGEDVQVTFGEGPELQPAIANDNAGNLLIGFIGDVYNTGEYNAWFTYSPDGGETWATDAIAWQIETPEYPDLDYWGEGTRFFGTLVPNPLDNDGSSLYIMECNNPADFENGYSMVYWTWSDVGDGYYNFIDVNIGCDNGAEDWSWGCTSMIGDHGSGLVQTPFFSYQFTEDGWAWIYRWSTGGDEFTYEQGTSTSVDIDPITHIAYPVWTYLNPETGLHDILFSKFDFSTWEPYDSYQVHPEIGGGNITTSVDDIYIDISAYNNNVIIVSQVEGENGKDIVCYYSSDGLETVETSIIANTPADEMYPKVVHLGENEAICIFVKDGNLYQTRTTDGGATWDEPVKINDADGTVIEERGTADLCKLGALWTDNRNGNADIYFDTVGAVPIINVESVQGGFGVKATIANVGTADAKDVAWSIDLEGLVFIGKHKEGVISSLPAGQSTTISSGLVFGIGPVTVTVTAGGSTATADGFIVGPFVLGL